MAAAAEPGDVQDRRSARRFTAPPIAALVVTVALAIAIATSLAAPLFAPLELWTLDARFRIRGPRAATGQVVVVALDDKTMQQAPQLFTKRTGIASVLDATFNAGAKVVGVDAFFAEPESPLQPQLTADVRAFVDDDAAFANTPEPAASLLRRVRDETRGDEVLARSLATAGRQTVLALHPRGADAAPLDESTLKRARYAQVAPGAGRAARNAPGFMTSLPELMAAAPSAGMITIELDDDQVGRRLAAARRHGGATIAPLAVHVAARALDIPPSQLGYVEGDAILLGARRRVPIFGDSLLLNFRGKRDAFPTYSAVDVVNGTIPPGALRDRAVLIGFSYLLHDVVPSPFDDEAAGLEVHTTAVDNLIAGDALTRSSPALDALFALALGLVVVLLYSARGPIKSAPVRLIASALLVVLAALIAHLVFTRSDTWLSLAAPASTAAAASLAALATGYLTEGAERRRLRKAFAHYLHDDVIAELMANPQALALGGARREVSVLFSDIRGFTNLAEKMEPLALSRFLNDYLTPMTRAVLEQRGFLDKYVGDAIMAVFGAPAPTQDHADRALAAALEMHRRLPLLRQTLHPDLAIGVGINSGDVVAGNMGSAERFDYTVIGDAVNLASRLEGLTKRYGVFCIVGDTTRKRASPTFKFREIDLVRVKGRAQPVAIHELIVTGDGAAAGYVDVDAFNAGLAAFRAGKFPDARAAFAKFREQNAGDAVCALYIERLAALGDTAPADWDGVFDHVSK